MGGTFRYLWPAGDNVLLLSRARCEWSRILLTNLNPYFWVLGRDNLLFDDNILAERYSRDNILAQKEQDPDPDQALRYYQVNFPVWKLLRLVFTLFSKQATFNYTENLREVLTNLRLRIVWVFYHQVQDSSTGLQNFELAKKCCCTPERLWKVSSWLQTSSKRLASSYSLLYSSFRLLSSSLWGDQFSVFLQYRWWQCW